MYIFEPTHSMPTRNRLPQKKRLITSRYSNDDTTQDKTTDKKGVSHAIKTLAFLIPLPLSPPQTSQPCVNKGKRTPFAAAKIRAGLVSPPHPSYTGLGILQLAPCV